MDFSLSRIVKRALSGTKARAVSMVVRSRGGRGGGRKREKKGGRGEVAVAAKREKEAEKKRRIARFSSAKIKAESAGGKKVRAN